MIELALPATLVTVIVFVAGVLVGAIVGIVAILLILARESKKYQ